MIDEAIQTTINPIVTCALIEHATQQDFPFAVFSVSTQPRRTKDGIVGYVTDCTVRVVSDQVDTAREKATLVIAAMEAVRNQTINSTLVEDVFFNDREPEYQPENEDSDEAYFLEAINFSINHTSE